VRISQHEDLYNAGMDTLSSDAITPGRLALRASIYYLVLFGAVISILNLWPEVRQYLPFGGRDALEGTSVQAAADLLGLDGDRSPVPADGSGGDAVQTAMFFLVGHLTGTILAMLPISWTYKAVNYEAGFRKSFARVLIVLPLCATTVVLLVQNNLALAFGLAAMVAAVRFRVTLDDAMDGIFIFAAICVGLAAGIGYLGIALVMSVFFCFANILMWAIDYGDNPADAARRKRKLAKQEKSRP